MFSASILVAWFHLFFLLASNNAFITTTKNEFHNHHVSSRLSLMAIKTKPTSLHLHQSKQTESIQNRVDLITFDLDDTLFPIAPIIREANEALLEHIETLGHENISQESITDSTKVVRAAMREAGEDVPYTKLRKLAIQREIEMSEKGQSQEISITESIDETVEGAYEQWEIERHASAERHLYADAVPMLQRLKEDYPLIVIGAITNGKGNPLEMKDTLAGFFDFCVSGEDAGVFPKRKPDPGIYDVAIQKYREITQKCSESDDDCVWFHVGDDLANDVGASAACGAKAIWVDLLEEYGQTASKRVSADLSKQPAWSTISKEELEKRRILAETARASVSARIERLSDLPEAILTFLQSRGN